MPVHLDEFRLNDDVLHADAEIIGPMDSYFYATWDRIDTAIAPLPHVGVRYRWTTDSSDDLALFIEIPVKDDPTVSDMIDARGRVRQALVHLDGDRPAYIHFLDHETVLNATADIPNQHLLGPGAGIAAERRAVALRTDSASAS